MLGFWSGFGLTSISIVFLLAMTISVSVSAVLRIVLRVIRTALRTELERYIRVDCRVELTWASSRSDPNLS